MGRALVPAGDETNITPETHTAIDAQVIARNIDPRYRRRHIAPSRVDGRPLRHESVRRLADGSADVVADGVREPEFASANRDALRPRWTEFCFDTQTPRGIRCGRGREATFELELRFGLGVEYASLNI